MPLLNKFLVGADPEFAILHQGHAQQFHTPYNPLSPWGLDHNNWVIEPHPKPALSIRELIQNLRVSFNDFARVAPEGRWRAGAYIQAPERTITLGGHIHLDLPRCTTAQRDALDLFTRHLEALDILPATECRNRRTSSYGHFGDIRTEHGHFEYRTMASWLFSQRVTKVCLLGAKLIAVDPTAPEEVLGNSSEASVARLRAFFERFKAKDDDADWILSGSLLHRKLNVRPDRDLRTVWRVEPQAETPHWKQEQQRVLLERAAAGRETVVSPYIFQVGDCYLGFVEQPEYRPTPDELLDLAQQVSAFNRDGRHLVESGWEPERHEDPRGRYRLMVYGIAGRSWRNYATLDYVIAGIHWHTCLFRLLASQIVNPVVTRTLIDWATEQENLELPGNQLVLRNGLLFQYMGYAD